MTLSYDSVVEAIRTLESEGRPLGARAIHDVLKTGSMTTIQKHLHRWREERARRLPVDLPESLHRAILDFAECEVRKGHHHLESHLGDVRSALDEALRTGEELEHRIATLEEDLRTKDTLLGEREETIRHLDVRLTESHAREQQEREEAHGLREELARANLRLDELPRLRDALEALRQKVDQEKEARTAAEKEAAVSRALLAEKDSSHKPSGRA